jgi:hypothetical protein
MCNEGTWRTASMRYCICSLLAHSCPWCTLWMQLQSSRKGYCEKQKQTAGAGAESGDYSVAIVGVEQNNLGDFGMSQVQSAHDGQVWPAVSGVVGIKGGDVDRQRVSRVQNKVWVKNACSDL